LAHCLFRNENRTRRQKKKERNVCCGCSSHTLNYIFERENGELLPLSSLRDGEKQKIFQEKGGLATTVKDEGSTTRIILRNMRRKRELFIIKKNMK